MNDGLERDGTIKTTIYSAIVVQHLLIDRLNRIIRKIMAETIQIKIDNYNEFFQRFAEHIDISNDYKNGFWIPLKTRTEYFGKLDYGKFTIYQLEKNIINKKIVLKITGSLKGNILEIRIRDYYQFVAIFNFTILAILSLKLITDLNIYIGYGLLCINIIQTLLHLIRVNTKKREFKLLINKLIENKRCTTRQ